jgi:hypothetical protein
MAQWREYIMTDKIIAVSEDFWNIRGEFKIGGVVNIGTQASLVRLASGNFLFLDSYAINSTLREEISELVDDTGEIEAIINLHPFHTVHVERMHELYPEARLYGTARHLERFPDLPWEEVRSEDPELHEWYAEDFEFTIPEGVDFISANENVHFSSVMAYHKASDTIHCDDTLMYIVLPRLLRLVGKRDLLSFHPTLSLALEKRPGAAADFRNWAQSLIDDWGDAQNLCAAHSQALLADTNRGGPIRARLQKALARVKLQLKGHELRYG